MTIEHLTQELMALPIDERVELAQALWQSVNEGLQPAPDEEAAAIADAKRRDAEMSAGVIAGRSHQQVMEAARRIIECK